MYWRALAGTVVLAGLMGTLLPGQGSISKTDLQKKLKDVEVAGGWIYDDLDAGFAEAKRTGKPLLVVLRCVP